MDQATLSGPTQKRMLAGGENLSTIGDMARRYGVTLRALRFYEDRGLIHPYRQGTARYYDAATRNRLETILKGKQLGFTLGQIAALLPAQNEDDNPRSLNLDHDQILTQIDRLERKRIELDAALEELRAAHRAMAQAGTQPGSQTDADDRPACAVAAA